MDANELLTAIKKAAVDAVEAKKPVQICFGQVLSTTPLQINVEQKMLLGEKQLTLTRNVTTYLTTMTDSIEGIRTVTVNNALAAGDKVLLIRQQEGKKFIVVDRI